MKNGKTEWRIETDYAVFAISVDANNIIIDAAPIGNWMVDKHLQDILNWCRHKGFKAEQL